MPATRHCLLIVDDEPDVCDSVHDLLRREFRVFKANSADEGYRIMQEEEVHIVMSDQRMPQITGVELLTKVKARHPQAITDAVHGVRRPGIDHRGDQPGAHLSVHEEAVAAGGADRGGAAGRGRSLIGSKRWRTSASTWRRKSTELKQRVSALETEVQRLQRRIPVTRRPAPGGRPGRNGGLADERGRSGAGSTQSFDVSRYGRGSRSKRDGAKAAYSPGR